MLPVQLLHRLVEEGTVLWLALDIAVVAIQKLEVRGAAESLVRGGNQVLALLEADEFVVLAVEDAQALFFRKLVDGSKTVPIVLPNVFLWQKTKH